MLRKTAHVHLMTINMLVWFCQNEGEQSDECIADGEILQKNGIDTIFISLRAGAIVGIVEKHCQTYKMMKEMNIGGE